MRRGAAPFVLAAGLAAATGLAACGGAGEDDPTIVRPSGTASPTTTSPTATGAPAFDGTLVTVEYSGGKVRTADTEVAVRKGTRIRLVVTSDVADEVHVHTYDLKAAVTPGTPATIEFVATATGIFEVELEDAGKLLVELRVS